LVSLACNRIDEAVCSFPSFFIFERFLMRHIHVLKIHRPNLLIILIDRAGARPASSAR
jgi:hypothetical protein